MSMSRFIREIAENGIRTARSVYGSLDKKATKAQKERIAAAKKKFKDRPKTRRKSEPEGMARDPKAGSNVRGGVDVDKGKAGKVTRSQDPGFLQQQRTPGSRAAAQMKADLDKKKREGTATKRELETLAALRRKDVVDEGRARARASATARGKKRKEPDDFAIAINRETGEINEAAFNRLTANQQKLLIQDIKARFAGPRAREIMARIDELEPTKAGETGVRRRRGGPKGMQGATERNVKDIDEGVGGRGGLDFNKGGAAKKKKKVPVVTIGIGMMPVPKGKKPRTGSTDFRNGGMVTETKNNLKPIPPGKKGKGLSMLPQSVRNNMGFMRKGGMVKK